MDIVPATYFENLKRYWKRKKYQRLGNATHNKKKLKITRLGTKNRPVLKIKPVPKLRFIMLSPLKLLAKFHNNIAHFGGKKIRKDKPVPMVLGNNDEVVDGRLVLEIYNRLVSSHELASLMV